MELESFISSNIRNFFRVDSFYFTSLGSFLLKVSRIIRKAFLKKYIKIFNLGVKKFHFLKYEKYKKFFQSGFFRKKNKKLFSMKNFEVVVVKYKKCFNLREPTFHFTKYKKNFSKKIWQNFLESIFLFFGLGIKSAPGSPIICYFLNMSGFWIYHGSKLARVTQGFEDDWICWIIPRYAWLCLNMRNSAWVAFVLHLPIVIPYLKEP